MSDGYTEYAQPNELPSPPGQAYPTPYTQAALDWQGNTPAAASSAPGDASAGYCAAYLPQGSYNAFYGCLSQEQSATVNQQADRINHDLSALQTGSDPRNNSALESDLRSAFFSMTPQQMGQVEQSYKSIDPAGLGNAISSNAYLSQDTKDILAPCLAPANIGSDPAAANQRTAALLNVSLNKQNPELFKEAMAYASPEARQAFLNNDGATHITSAFGNSSDAQQLLQYAQQGKPDTLSSVKNDSSLIFGSNGGISLSLQQMSDSDRQKYIEGARIASVNGSNSSLTSDQQGAKSYYDQMTAAFNKEGNPAQALAWQYMIYNGSKADSFVPSLARHYGYLGSDSISTITQDIGNMSQQDWQDCKANPARRDQVAYMLKTLGKDQSDINSFLTVYDRKIGAANFQESENATAAKTNTPDDTSLVERMNSCKGWFGFGNDYDQAFQTLQHASADDRAKLLDPDHKNDNFRQEVLGFMDSHPDQQQIAWAIIQQGKMNPEDKIRASVLDDKSAAVINQLSQLNTGERSHAVEAYLQKYHASMSADILNLMPDHLKPNVTQLLSQDTPPDQVAALAGEQTAVARGGWTGGITGLFNGTGSQADAAALGTNVAAAQLNQLQQDLLKQASLGISPSSEQAKRYMNLVRSLDTDLQTQYQATGNYVSSRRIISQYATAAVLAPAGIAAPFGVGIAVSAAGTPLLKSFFQGSNYDSRPLSVVTDSIEAAGLSALGQLGKNATSFLPRMSIKAGNGAVGWVADKVAGKIEQVPNTAIRY